MASNLRVDTILPSSGTTLGIGTAGGTINFLGNSNLTTSGDVTIGGNLGVGGTITYEDVARVDATGISTFREGYQVGPLTGIALTAYKDGSIRTTGIITASSFGSDTNSIFTTGGTERLRVTSTGQILVGTTSDGGTYDGVTPHFVSEVSGNYQAYTLSVNANHAGQSSILQFVKSRGTSDGANTIVQDGDRLGSIYAIGADGTNRDSAGAAIDFRVDGTPGANDMPGRIEFRTTADGAVVPTERLRITSTGDLKFSTGSRTGNVNSICAANGHSIDLNGSEYLYFRTAAVERMRIKADGNVLIGTDAWSYPKALNVQGPTGSILSLSNYDTTTYAADTNASIELLLKTGNTGNQNGTCEIRGGKTNATNGNNARYLSFWTGTNGGSNAESMRIWDSGAVTKPRNFTFLVESNGTSVTTGWNKLTGLSIDTSNSNWMDNTYWDGSNQRFTVPITGTYMLYFGGWGNQNDGNGRNRYATTFKINNANYNYISGGAYCDADSPLNTHCISQRLTSGQYVELWYYSSQSGTWGGGHRVYWGATLLG